MDQVMEFLTNWGAVLGYFLMTGGFMEGMKRSVGGNAGDVGLKGFWYSWKRAVLVTMGLGLGAAGHYVGIPHGGLGDELGGGVLSGLIGAAIAAWGFDLIMGTVRARAAHKLARSTLPGDAPGDGP